MASERIHNRESTETLRERCIAVREATIGADGGAIPALQERLSYLPEAERLYILDDILALQNRIRRYLVKKMSARRKTTEEQTPFAEMLATEPDQLTSAQQRAFYGLSDVVASELSPILWRIHEQIGAAAPRVQRISAIQEIATPEGLLVFVTNGRYHGKESLSFFGAYERLRKAHAGNEAHKPSPLIKAPESMRERTLHVQDPLRDRAYWAGQRIKRREMYGKTVRLGELVGQKSYDAADDIERIANRYRVRVSLAQREARTQGDRETKERIIEQVRDLRGRRDSYRHLVEWLRGMAYVIQLVPDKDFLRAGYDLSLLDGEYEEARKLLNALEFLKHDDPRLYARLLGIAPNVETQESKQSDWSGNAAHIAFVNSLNVKVRSDREGSQTLQQRLKKLTMLDEQQAELYPVNQQMWQTLQIAALGAREPQSVLPALGLTGMALYLESHRISKLLQERGREEKEDALARMRTEHPAAFIDDVKKHFKPPLDARDQAALEQVFVERGLEHLIYSMGEEASAIMGFEAVYANLLQGFEINFINFQARARIMQALWETAPAEELLNNDEFYYYIIAQAANINASNEKIRKVEDQLRKIDEAATQNSTDSTSANAVERQKGDTGEVGDQRLQLAKQLEIARREMNNKREQFLILLAAHADITKDQWLAWQERSVSGRRKAVQSAAMREAIKMFQFTGEDILDSPSSFFVTFWLFAKWGREEAKDAISTATHEREKVAAFMREKFNMQINEYFTAGSRAHVPLVNLQYKLMPNQDFVKMYTALFRSWGTRFFFAEFPEEQKPAIVRELIGYFISDIGNIDILFNPLAAERESHYLSDMLNIAEQYCPDVLASLRETGVRLGDKFIQHKDGSWQLV